MPLLTLLLWGSLVAHQTFAASELPALGDGSSAISPSQEKELGRAWLRQLRGQVPLISDPAISDYLEDLLYRLVPNSELLDSDLIVTVIDSPELNAFAVPGGVIGVNAGMFLYADTEQELAGVLSHELAHLSQRHYARRLEESNKQLALNLAGLLASIVIGATAGTDAGVAAMASAQALSIHQQLSYSRQNEQEADRLGIQTLNASGMNASAMASMFSRMMRNERFNRAVPEYFRTHPLTESRVSDMGARSSSYPARLYEENQDFYFIQARAKTLYATSPKDALAHFKALAQSTRRELQLEALYGEVMALIQANRPSEAENALEALLGAMPNAIMPNLLKLDWLMAQRRTDEALKLVQQQLSLNPGNYPLTRAQAHILTERMDYAGAYSLLKRLSLTHTDDAGLWYDLAEAAGQANAIVELHRARAEYFFMRADTVSALKQLEQALTKSKDNYQQSVLIRKRMQEIEGSTQAFTF